MICPCCGVIDYSIPSPNYTRKGTKRILGVCKNCNKEIYCIPTKKNYEKSQQHTVNKGELREEMLSNIYIENMRGAIAKNMPKAHDIDRVALDEYGKPIYFFEIKERSNTLNAYKEIKFPYAKIKSAKKLIKHYNIPVFVVLKFSDCWTRFEVKLNKKYKQGKIPFAPNYRPNQRNKQRQIPALIDIYDLTVLNFKEKCKDS
ncbi:hypothetical protein [Halonatronum saccharophilum]|uniref:hypothetical protein n=1 Tax=Halonatronum saccharophilum TaxID=150060 RepID=UPI000486DBA4|nr:hypothetical protein [Halonatronum saccharophilum]